MVTYKGSQAVGRTTYRHDRAIGWVVVQWEKGVPSFISGRAEGYRQAGYNVRVDRSGPYMALFAERVASTPDTPFVERWSVQNEILETDIFNRQPAIVEGEAFSGGAHKYAKGIRTAYEGREALDVAVYPTGTFPFAHKILFELNRGGEGFQRSYIILTRELTQALTQTQSINITKGRTIYTTAQLISNENIPDEVSATLPADPSSALAQSKWGWRVRNQEAEIDSDFKVTLRASWAFARWSTFYYTEA